METNQFINALGTSDYESWILVQEAHLKNAYDENIEECGFNMMSGYIYIALENGILIASCFGQPVEFIKYNNDTDEELFFDTYEEALNN